MHDFALNLLMLVYGLLKHDVGVPHCNDLIVMLLAEVHSLRVNIREIRK